MELLKAHGTANDFVVIADLDDRVVVSAGAVRALTDRRTGIGGDGLIRIGAPPDDQRDADVFMDYRNADGSVVEMCGNGVRVTAKLAVDGGYVTAGDGDVVRVATRAGTKPVVVHLGDDGRVAEVTVDMGPPILSAPQVPFEAAAGADPLATTHPLDVDDAPGHGVTRVEVAVVSMGNPHAVLVTDDVANAPVTTLGPRIETHPRFPAKVNVGFAQVVDRDRIRLRVWERGVGETAACGTGACAATVALQRLGQLDEVVEVALPGGVLTITHAGSGTVWMRGPAVEVARLTLVDPSLTRLLTDQPPARLSATSPAQLSATSHVRAPVLETNL